MSLFDVQKPFTKSPFDKDSRFIKIDGLMFKSSFLWQNIPGGGIGYRFMPFCHHLVLPRYRVSGKWFHYCTSYSSLNHIIHIYQDGLKVFSHLYADDVENPSVFSSMLRFESILLIVKTPT